MTPVKNDTPEFIKPIYNKINDIVKKIDDAKVSKEYLDSKNFVQSFIWNRNKIKTNSPRKSNTNKIIENINEKLFLANDNFL